MSFIIGSQLLTNPRRAGAQFADAPLSVFDLNDCTIQKQDSWFQASRYYTEELLMPLRQKNMEIHCSNDEAISELKARLSTLDSEYVDQSQTYKLYKLLESMRHRFFNAVVNISSSDNSNKNSFYLLSLNVPLYVYVVYNTVDHSSSLLWCSDDSIKSRLRKLDLTRYSFYEMPTLMTRPLFISNLHVCGRWYSFQNSFGATPAYMLTACNALEVMLYKEPQM